MKHTILLLACLLFTSNALAEPSFKTYEWIDKYGRNCAAIGYQPTWVDGFGGTRRGVSAISLDCDWPQEEKKQDCNQDDCEGVVCAETAMFCDEIIEGTCLSSTYPNCSWPTQGGVCYASPPLGYC